MKRLIGEDLIIYKYEGKFLSFVLDDIPKKRFFQKRLGI
jgi:hypothetical protein